MAARDTVRNRLKTASGGLAETSAEELSKQVGRPLAPVSPMETGVIGGNKDQAKMAGTPAQKTSALRTALQGQNEQDLSTRMRREQVRRTASGAESEKMAAEDRTQQLGSLQGRVQQLAKNALSKKNLEENATTASLALEGEDEAALLLNKILANPNDLEAIKDFNLLMGKTSNKDILSADEILENFGIVTDPETGKSVVMDRAQNIIGKAVGTSIEDKITSGEINFEEMGFTGIDEVASLLGTDAASLSKMTIEELQQQLDTQIQNEYTAVEDLQRKAGDLSLGAAERAEAKKLLREMGAVGIRSAETDIDELAEEIADANVIEFMGEEIELEELLDSDYMAGIVKNFFQDPEFAKELKENEPALFDFIEKYKGILKGQADSVSDGIANFAKIQQTNASMINAIDGPIDPEVMEQWIPGFGDISTEVYKVPEVVELLSSDATPEADRKGLNTTIKTLVGIGGAELVGDLGKMSAQDIKKLGLTDPNSDTFKKTKVYFEDVEAAENLDPNDHEAVAALMGASSVAELENVLTEAKKREAFNINGDKPSQSLSSLLREGLTVAGSQLQKALQPKLGLSDILNGANIPNISSDFKDAKKFAEESDAVFDIIESALDNDDVVAEWEIREIGKDLDISQLNILNKDNRVIGHLKSDHDRIMLDMATDKLLPEVNDLTAEVGFGSIEDMTAGMLEPHLWEVTENYEHINDMFSRFEAGMNSRIAAAKAEGNDLTVKALSDILRKQKNEKRQFDTHRENHVWNNRPKPAEKKKKRNELTEIGKQLKKMYKF